MNLCRITRAKQLPQLKQYMSPEQFAYYENAFATCTGYKDMCRRVYLVMFKDLFSTDDEMLEYLTITGRLDKVKVPVFAFGAQDDVILNPATIPTEEIESLDNPFCVATSSKGAHCCHLTGTFLPRCWYQIPCSEFLTWLDKRLGKLKSD